jgi:cyclopropane-fatty-acyl-phospholipid synthase
MLIMINYLLERDLIPELLIRKRIRSLLNQRLQEEYTAREAAGSLYKLKIKKKLSQGPIAIETRKANEQHYEVPARFYELVLGKHLKYSCGHWDNADSLDSSELEMLSLTTQRAELSNGQSILELGCGWGSLSLFMAEKFPGSTFTSVSNSHSQAEHIRTKAKQRGLSNITVITSDINDLLMSQQFDRIVSIEMFEHMRNYEALLEKTHRWLKLDGKMFIHIFTHKDVCYMFDVKDDTDWMAKYFFSGGIMPSDWLLHEFSHLFKVSQHWKVDGTHYAKTSEAWLSNIKKHKQEVLQLFKDTYSEDPQKWYVYWKIFFMSCAELWNYKNGEEWIVSHYLLEK